MSLNGFDCLAMILAGGKGTRLEELTTSTAKPAVPFGGKYRIIDFTLSNCCNSGINKVGVLTQYKPFELNYHIGEGSNWDLNGTWGGVYLLPPYTGKNGGSWYNGTADAIYQNLDFILYHNPTYVLILSGDHIYQMDYRKMLESHINNQAEVTISVMEVPMEETHRFGIMNTDNQGKIFEFEEKPDSPKNNLASMGIYIFNTDILKNYLIKDNGNPNSSNDFGKDVIPLLLSEKRDLYAYLFQGYWKDVGTIKSYYDANMELLSQDCPLQFHSSTWPVLTDGKIHPPQYISNDAQLKNSIICEGSQIEGSVINSIIFPGVTVEKGSQIEDSILMERSYIHENTEVSNLIICQDAVITPSVKIGSSHDGEPNLISKNTVVSKGTQQEEVLL